MAKELSSNLQDSGAFKKVLAVLATTILVLGGLVASAVPAHGVTWRPWGPIPLQTQYEVAHPSFSPTDSTVPVYTDLGFKPYVYGSAGFTQLDVEFAYFYASFSAGYGSCTDSGSGLFTCPGGLTVQTTQPAGNPYGVTVQLADRPYSSWASWNPIPTAPTDARSATIVVSWTSTAAVNFTDTLTEVHVPANFIVVPNAADLLKPKDGWKSMFLGAVAFDAGHTPRTQFTGGYLTQVTAQTLPWSPNLNLSLSQSPATPSVAPVPTGAGVVYYSKDASSTSDCTVDLNTGVITYTTTGTCVVRAMTPGDATYGWAENTQTFNITSAPGVTFTNVGGGGAPPTVASGNVASMPDGTGMTPPAGSGAFSGWSCNDGTTTTSVPAGAALTVTSNTTCAAQWTPYPVTYSAGVGSGTAPNSTSGVVPDMPAQGSMVPPPGMYWVGWTCTPGGAVAEHSTFTPTAATACAANWASYDVNFFTGSGGGLRPSSGSGVTTMPDATGMTAPANTYLGGWDCVPGGFFAVGATLTPSTIVDCTARWNPIYTVNFNPGTGTGTAPSNLTAPIASLPGVGNMIAPTGNTFDGWSCFDGVTTQLIAAGQPLNPSANTTCTAQWKALPIVTFSTGLGSGTAPANLAAPIGSMPDGTGMTPPAGQQFAGWTCHPTAGGVSVVVSKGAMFNPSADTTCLATWENIPSTPQPTKVVAILVDSKTIVEGGQLPEFTTNLNSEIESLNCGVYAFTDRSYSNKLSASELTAKASPYVIHCIYKSKSGYIVAAYSDGVLNVEQTRTPGTPDVKSLTHRLKSIFYFNGDSPKLRAATLAGLKKIAKKVGKKSKVNVAVQGFVKRTASTSYDYRLSMDRALNIVAYLKKLGLEAAYSANSQGIAKENNSKARRAEVTIRW
jgi:outer membrane protein OmpA-like peptidoglycan-associated protein